MTPVVAEQTHSAWSRNGVGHNRGPPWHMQRPMPAWTPVQSQLAKASRQATVGQIEPSDRPVSASTARGWEALRGELTAAQLATKHGIHQTMVGEWKKQAMEGLASVFSGKEAAQEGAKSAEAEVEKLHAKIGRLVVERDFSAQASGR